MIKGDLYPSLKLTGQGKICSEELKTMPHEISAAVLRSSGVWPLTAHPYCQSTEFHLGDLISSSVSKVGLMPNPTYGGAVIDRLIDDAAIRRARGEKVVLLWDADDTLLRPRHRMLATVHAFGCLEAQLHQMKPTWQETAEGLGLDQERFFEFWNVFFWKESTILEDRPIWETASRARRAQALGVENMILTGRTEHCKAATKKQLQQLGLKATVRHKGKIGADTPAFKAATVRQLKEQGYYLRFFVSDSPEEIAALQAPEMRTIAPELVCVMVISPPAQPDISMLDPNTPLMQISPLREQLK